MASFDDFFKSLQDLVDSYSKQGVMLKVDSCVDGGIIRIFGENSSSISRAKNGLEDVVELAYTTAEHHPYWNLLYHACQISKTVLDKWDDTLTQEDIGEISWSIDELKNTSDKIRQRPDSDHVH